MFTGIILKMGNMVSLEKKSSIEITIDVDLSKNIKIGDSIAVNGACLTVIQINSNRYKFNLSRETLRLSNFDDLIKGSFVNIELPLTLNDFLSGHLVSGHLDGTVRVKSINRGVESSKICFTYQDRSWKNFLVNKGSITLNGISLTITDVKGSFFSVNVIPHTFNTTSFKYLKIGERVNIELDLIAKYLYNLM
jgi:riboflavin synthase